MKNEEPSFSGRLLVEILFHGGVDRDTETQSYFPPCPGISPGTIDLRVQCTTESRTGPRFLPVRFMRMYLSLTLEV
jgi:hypothetical protein